MGRPTPFRTKPITAVSAPKPGPLGAPPLPLESSWLKWSPDSTPARFPPRKEAFALKEGSALPLVPRPSFRLKAPSSPRRPSPNPIRRRPVRASLPLERLPAGPVPPRLPSRKILLPRRRCRANFPEPFLPAESGFPPMGAEIGVFREARLRLASWGVLPFPCRARNPGFSQIPRPLGTRCRRLPAPPGLKRETPPQRRQLANHPLPFLLQFLDPAYLPESSCVGSLKMSGLLQMAQRLSEGVRLPLPEAVSGMPAPLFPADMRTTRAVLSTVCQLHQYDTIPFRLLLA